MKALFFNGKDLVLKETDKPVRQQNEVLIKVTLAGICNTDHEITRGYVPGFNAIPGHEFTGIVEEAEDPSLVGKTVTAEINCACGDCDFCHKDLGRHCPHRTVLGIISRNGAMAEYVTVPGENVVIIPPGIPENQAIFIEPLAAACEIPEQVPTGPKDKVLLLGDGKLAILIAAVLQSTGCSLLAVGKHREKLRLMEKFAVKTCLTTEFTPGAYDMVVEASGNPTAFETGLACVKPRGTFVLKSTYAGKLEFNPAPLVVNEITLTGSRCGRFEDAISFLQKHNPDFSNLISAEYKLSRALEAFQYSSRKDTLKVLLRM